jgi:hypothetical protein
MLIALLLFQGTKMSKRLTVDQHQMLEDLTGKQYTRYGISRKSYRHAWETRKLGSPDKITRGEDKREELINSYKKRGLTSEQARAELVSLGESVISILILLLNYDSRDP